MGPLGRKAGAWGGVGGGVHALPACPSRGQHWGLGEKGHWKWLGVQQAIQRWGGGAGEARSRAVLRCQGGWLEPQPFSPSIFPEGPEACQARPRACPEPMAT